MTVIFSKRPDTEFLRKVWEGIENVRVFEIEGHHDASKIRMALDTKDSCFMLCGHGTPSGLLFPDLFDFIIGDNEASLLKDKTLVGIWCYAAEFADYNHLSGFFTSMFISDRSEALAHGYEATAEEVDAANRRFAKRINQLLRSKVPIELWENALSSYRRDMDRASFEYYNYCGMVNLNCE